MLTQEIKELIETLEGFAGVWVKASERLPDEEQETIFKWYRNGDILISEVYTKDSIERRIRAGAFNGGELDSLKWLDTSESTKEQILSLLSCLVIEENDEEAAELFLSKLAMFPHYAMPKGAFLAGITHARLQMQAEIYNLKRWKQEQLACTPDWQALGKAMNIDLGKSVHDKVLPFMQSQSAEIKALEEKVRELEGRESYYIDSFQLIESGTEGKGVADEVLRRYRESKEAKS